MDLILVQHGEAAPEEIDPKRPLTARGREVVERIARAAAQRGVAVTGVWHSGKRRAAETAGILAAHLSPGNEPREMAGLAPGDDPRIAAEALGATRAPLAVAGHLPHLSRLASLLVTGDPDIEVVAFRNSGLVALGRDGAGWRIAWILTPELVD